MTGTSRYTAEELAGLSRGGGRWRLGGNTGEQKLGGTIGDAGDSADEDSGLDGTSGDWRNRDTFSSKTSAITKAGSSSPSMVGVWVGLHFIPKYSTKTKGWVMLLAHAPDQTLH